MDNKKIEELLGALYSKIDIMDSGNLNTKIALEVVEMQTILKRILEHQQDTKNDVRRIYDKFDIVYKFIGDEVDKLEIMDKENSENLSRAMQKLYFSVAGGAVLFILNLAVQLIKQI